MVAPARVPAQGNNCIPPIIVPTGQKFTISVTDIYIPLATLTSQRYVKLLNLT